MAWLLTQRDVGKIITGPILYGRAIQVCKELDVKLVSESILAPLERA